MNRFALPAFFLSAALVLGYVIYSAAPTKTTVASLPVLEAFPSPPFALVELFTSEGCSSCPPADRVLARLTEEARSQNLPLYTLSFHVDYWNYLGWADPYSDSAFSDRQRTYTRILGTRTYTPQMIVNGAQVFVGSDEIKARSSIQAALQLPAKATVELSNLMLSEQVLQLDFQVTGMPENAVLQVAVVERGLSQAIPRGENKGRTLSHEQVVRVFHTETLPEGRLRLGLPDDLNHQKASVIAFVQDRETMRIWGASMLDIDAD